MSGISRPTKRHISSQRGALDPPCPPREREREVERGGEREKERAGSRESADGENGTASFSAVHSEILRRSGPSYDLRGTLYIVRPAQDAVRAVRRRRWQDIVRVFLRQEDGCALVKVSRFLSALRQLEAAVLIQDVREPVVLAPALHEHVVVRHEGVARPMPSVLAAGGSFFYFAGNCHCFEELDEVRLRLVISGVFGECHRHVADRVGVLKHRKGPPAFFSLDTAAT